MKIQVYNYDEKKNVYDGNFGPEKVSNELKISDGRTRWIRVSGDEIEIVKDDDKKKDTISKMEKELGLSDKYEMSNELSDQYNAIKIKRDVVIISLSYPYYKKAKVGEKEEDNEIRTRLLKQQVTEHNLKIIVTENNLISISEKEIDNFNRIGKRITEEGLSKEKIKKTDYLAFALIKSLIDNYFYIIDMIGKDIYDLNSIKDDHKDNLKVIQHLRDNMMNLRKSIYPLKALFSELLDTESTLINKDARDFFRKLQTHVFQLMDLLAMARDQVSASMEVYLNRTTTKMNEVMKVLTILASIFLPLTFITGIYGMNFITEADVRTTSSPTESVATHLSLYNDPLVLTIFGGMIILAVGLILIFRNKKYFG